MSGVAAKFRGIYPMNPCLKNVRLRQRAALRSLRIPAQISEGPVSKADSIFSPHTDKVGFLATIAPVQFLSGSETLEPLEIDTDTETTVSTETGTDSDETWSSITKTSRKSSCLADLSSFLRLSQFDNDGDTMMKQPGSRTLTRENSCDIDSYGWESEYDRQLDCGNANPARGCSGLGYHKA
ncbi:hypothetical protein F4782DRAFT_354920 [Xylaria castorea]|nr:hypothetical protein F4782DRAFT_354920 [Xylaria castorea]